MSSESADDIRKRMAAVRNDMHADVRALVRSARVKTDWRHYVERYPWLSIGAAAALGFWLVPKAAQKIVFDPALLAKFKTGEGSASTPRGKSVLELIAGTVMPLVTRFAMNKLMAHFLEVEQPAEPQPVVTPEPSDVFSRYQKPK